MLEENYKSYFNSGSGISAKEPALVLLDELVFIGDSLNTIRKSTLDIDDAVAQFNESLLGFKLDHKVRDVMSDIGIHPSRLRVKLGLSQEDDPIFPYFSPKDKIKIKAGEIGSGVLIDAAANFRDGDPNWAVCKSIKNLEGAIETAAVYMPCTGEIYVADQEAAHHIFLPRNRSEKTIVHSLQIRPLRTKFSAEVGSWHTKERSPVKAVFSTLIRENIGGSLHETGMTEVPFAWVASGARGYTFVGNLNKGQGDIGAFIAEKGGAHIIRMPIISDAEGRDALFAIHPDIAGEVLEKFYQGIELAEGDVIIGAPIYVSNSQTPKIMKNRIEELTVNI